MLLTTALGQCIRFAVDDVRVFKGRDSMGVRGVSLAKGDSVISLAILRQFEASGEERAAYLKMRRAMAGETGEEAERRRRGGGRSGEATAAAGASLSPERYAEMSAAEQIILTVSEQRLRQAHVVVRISVDRARRQRHRRHGGQRRATAISSPPFRSRMATRSCW